MLNKTRQTPKRNPTAIAPPPSMPTEPRPMPNKTRQTPKPNPTAIAPPPSTPTEPPPMLNKTKQTPKRNPTAIGPPLRLPISNSSKRCRIVKNFAPDCCNNSTPSLLLATPLVASS